MNDWMTGALVGFAAGVAGGAVVTYLASRRPRAATVPPAPSKPPSKEAVVGASMLDSMLSQQNFAVELRQDLRVKMLYDEKKVEEAIEFERLRSPQASEEELLKAAIFRWERENR